MSTTIPLISITTEVSESSESESNENASESNTLGTSQYKTSTALTDVEDLSNSSGEEFVGVKLQTGTTKKKNKPSNYLGAQTDDVAELTDCENLQVSDAEEDISHPKTNINLAQFNSGVIDECESFKNNRKKGSAETRCKENLIESSSSSDTENVKMQRKKSNKPIKKSYQSEFMNNNEISDDDYCGAVCLPKLLDAEELDIDCSDVEDLIENIPEIPNIKISFQSVYNKKLNEVRVLKKTLNTLLAPQNIEEGVTDIENALSSSDDDDNDDDGKSSTLKIPNAIMGDQKYLTDTEDFEDPDYTKFDYTTQLTTIDIKQLPSPTRELVLLKESNSKLTSVSIMPLTPTHQPMLSIGQTNDSCLTDNETFSDVDDEDEDEENKFYSYTPETAAIIDNEIVMNSEKFLSAKFDRISLEPKTDTEELPSCKDAYRKRKHKLKQSRKLSTPNLNQNCLATTGFEEILFSDNISGHQQRLNIKPKRSLPTQLMIDQSDLGSKTDTEFISDDEDNKIQSKINYSNNSSHVVLNNFISTITSEENLSTAISSARNEMKPKIAITFNLTPNYDTQNPLTDTEDLLALSDIEEGNNTTFSRAPTATPAQMQNEYSECENYGIHEINKDIFDHEKEKLHVKGIHETVEATTDVEFVDEDDDMVVNQNRDDNSEL